MLARARVAEVAREGRSLATVPHVLEALEEALGAILHVNGYDYREDGNFIYVEDDPWGNVYVLETQGKRRLVRSFGPDGKRGTADDIVWPGGLK